MASMSADELLHWVLGRRKKEGGERVRRSASTPPSRPADCVAVPATMTDFCAAASSSNSQDEGLCFRRPRLHALPVQAVLAALGSRRRRLRLCRLSTLRRGRRHCRQRGDAAMPVVVAGWPAAALATAWAAKLPPSCDRDARHAHASAAPAPTTTARSPGVSTSAVVAREDVFNKSSTRCGRLSAAPHGAAAARGPLPSGRRHSLQPRSRPPGHQPLQLAPAALAASSHRTHHRLRRPVARNHP